MARRRDGAKKALIVLRHRAFVPSRLRDCGESGYQAQFHQLHAQHVLVARRDERQHRVAGPPVEVDAGHGGFGPGKNDVLGLLDVDGCGTKLVEDVRQHTGLVAVAHDEHVRGRRARRQVYRVGHLPTALEGRDDPDGLGGDGFLRLLG